MMDRAGISYEMELTQWSRAINLAEKKPTHACSPPPTPRNATRTSAGSSRWPRTGPFWCVAQAALSRRPRWKKPAPCAREPRRAITPLAFWKRPNFTTIDLSPNPDVTVKKLLGDRIDLMVTSSSFFDAAVAEGVAIEEVLTLSETIMSVACSLGTIRRS